MKETKEEEINCVCDIVDSSAGRGNPMIGGRPCTCEVSHAGEKGETEVTEKIQIQEFTLEARKKFNFNPADYWDLVPINGPRLKEGKLEGEYVIRRKARPSHT